MVVVVVVVVRATPSMNDGMFSDVEMPLPNINDLIAGTPCLGWRSRT